MAADHDDTGHAPTTRASNQQIFDELSRVNERVGTLGSGVNTLTTQVAILTTQLTRVIADLADLPTLKQTVDRLEQLNEPRGTALTHLTTRVDELEKTALTTPIVEWTRYNFERRLHIWTWERIIGVAVSVVIAVGVLVDLYARVHPFG